MPLNRPDELTALGSLSNLDDPRRPRRSTMIHCRAGRLLADPTGNLRAITVCDICGNDYDKVFTVTRADGRAATFDSIDCAAVEWAPLCAHCGCRILCQGVEADNAMYCCARCTRRVGNADVNDRYPAPAGA